MYDAAGTLVWCPHNLVARSGDASDAVWTKNGVSVAGTTITVTATGGSKSISQWVGGAPDGPVTLCLRVRAGASSMVSLGLYSGGFVAATASVLSGPGVVSGTGLIQVTGLSAGTQTVIVLQATAPAGGIGVFVYPGGDTTGANVVGDSVEFDDIRLNVGALQPYYPTTSAAYYGPRLTYDPVTHAALGLLVEEQRTNLLTYSGALDNAAITKSNSSVVAASATAPDGTLTGFKLREDSTASADHRIYWTVTTTAVGHVLSVFAKAAERSWMYLRMDRSGGGTPRVWFDLANGVVGTAETGTSGAITSVGGGWYRCSLILDTAAVASVNPLIGITTANGATAYSGDGSSGIYVWGAQLEAGAFATSYIPTGAASATRAADVVTCTGAAFSQWFNSADGTLLVEFTQSQNSAARYILAGDNASTRIAYGYANDPALYAYDGAHLLTYGNSVVGANKLAFAYSAGQMAGSLNGGATVTAVANGNFAAMTVLKVGEEASGLVFLNGTIKRVRYWRKRLTNAQLQALTA